MSRVLVTGGSGFIASQTILQLLEAGCEVRATARSPGATLYTDDVVVADLTQDAGWPEAVAGCDYVLHVASPFPPGAPKHEDDLIIPARDGTLRVLTAARDAGVRRVVLTSSFAAIGYGHPPQRAPFTEADWTDLTAPGLNAYAKSKTLAERAAWDFIAREGGAMELSVINPVGVFGPTPAPDRSSSIGLVKRILDGAMPFAPRLYFGVVDVRDVADLHIRAMTHPAATGQRFLAVAGDFMSLQEIARTLHVRAHQLPDWLVRVAASVSPTLRQYLPELGKAKNATAEKARRLLGWSPRSSDVALLATAESLGRRR
ncbi:MAG TPA: aldehyde reductase [Gemmatimonadaceae bacterium]|jgi:nucleoside-diphosphate-sugar epimerase|nr:aldehyde reductase [Gemmatimonadaceae bacterium]